MHVLISCQYRINHLLNSFRMRYCETFRSPSACDVVMVSGLPTAHDLGAVVWLWVKVVSPVT